MPAKESCLPKPPKPAPPPSRGRGCPDLFLMRLAELAGGGDAYLQQSAIDAPLLPTSFPGVNQSALSALDPYNPPFPDPEGLCLLDQPCNQAPSFLQLSVRVIAHTHVAVSQQTSFLQLRTEYC